MEDHVTYGTGLYILVNNTFKVHMCLCTLYGSKVLVWVKGAIARTFDPYEVEHFTIAMAQRRQSW